ncbi:PaaI family thioesterase [Rhodoferax ferrireducens]|uniref:PaaI family thioesterase n=1 Tax=Rhodoferax ferrireducens TaxID=192843 RepID=UPI000E0DE923|nr:PaaI family thioesterase [Rhodoferax ferrireducens]
MSNTDPSKSQRIVDYKRSWRDNTFLKAQSLEVEEIGTGEVVVRLPQVLPSQRGGGGTDHVLNGGVVSYMFDGALGWAIISSLLAMPEALEIDPFELRQFTMNLDITYLDAAIGDRFEAHGKVVRVSRSTAFAEGRFLDANGKVCATAKGIWRVFWPRNNASTPA